MVDLIDEIVPLEWEMLSNVPDIDGMAPCRSDFETFSIIRGSRLAAWTETLRQSYLNDLKRARREGRNLMAEKFAWTLELAFPEKFAELASGLPEFDLDSLNKIEVIVAINLSWKEELAEWLPKLSCKDGPVYTRSDSAFQTSFETSLRSELKTCSPETLSLYYTYAKTRKKEGVNCVALALLEQVKRYGYASLKEAERAMGASEPGLIADEPGY